MLCYEMHILAFIFISRASSLKMCYFRCTLWAFVDQMCTIGRTGASGTMCWNSPWSWDMKPLVVWWKWDLLWLTSNQVWLCL